MNCTKSWEGKNKRKEEKGGATLAGMVRAGLCEEVPCSGEKGVLAGGTVQVKALRWDKPGESGEQQGDVRGGRGEERCAGRAPWAMRGLWEPFWGLGKSGESFFKFMSRWRTDQGDSSAGGGKWLGPGQVLKEADD